MKLRQIYFCPRTSVCGFSRMKLFLMLSFTLSCRAISPIEPSQREGLIVNNTRLTKERILELSPALLREVQDYRVPINRLLNTGLESYSLEEIILLKNSIFAQYGRSFSTPWLEKYFKSRFWYKKAEYEPTLLTDLDKQNLALLASVQQRLEDKRRAAVSRYNPIGYIEIGGAFAETFFHLFCPNQTYVFLDYHDLIVRRGTWHKAEYSLQVSVAEECKYTCLKEEPLECERSKLNECRTLLPKGSRKPEALIEAEQFEEFLDAGSHSGNHDLGWHYNYKRHPLTGRPKLCDLTYKPKTFEEAARNFRGRNN